MEYKTIRLSVEGAVATLTLNRPEALNALSSPMVDELAHALGAIEKDERLKVLVVRGEGRAFCAGADLIYLEEALHDPSLLRRYVQRVNGVMFRLEELPIPVVAVVHGYALAGGLELLLSCDIAIAAEDAHIGDQHINFGLIPGGGATQRLPRRIGVQRALELMLTGRWLTGREAEEWGLVLRAVPREKLDEELDKLLASLRDKSRLALGWIKKTALGGAGLPLREGIAMEVLAFVQHLTTSSDPREGIKAFKEKRRPAF